MSVGVAEPGFSCPCPVSGTNVMDVNRSCWLHSR